VLLAAAVISGAQGPPVSQRIAATAMSVFPNGHGDVWNYHESVVLEGMEGVWYGTANGEYFHYIQRCVDRFVGADGSIRSYKPEDLSLDNVLMGRQLILLYEVTGQEKYYKAATQIYNQLKQQPRTPEGGFWHRKTNFEQMWLDSLYVAEPFYAEYAARFHHPEDFDDIARQFTLLEQHARDPKTGLLYQGWDPSKQQRWANPKTGASPSLWSRGMGWYAMGLVDTLEYLPASHPAHARLVAMLNRFARAIVAQQDANGVWYQVADKPGAKGNYEESSASAMFVYALARGVREGWLPESYRSAAKKGYQGILTRFVKDDGKGMLELTGTSSDAGLGVALGGDPVYRDGSYLYYTSVPTLSNEARGLGALLLASNEMERMPTLPLGAGRTVLLDSWYSSETRKDITGATVPYHYKWEEMDNAGLSLLAHAFHSYGVDTKTLYTAPTAKDLAGADIYIIMDPNFETTPDNPHYNPHPNYITPQDAKVIADWVQAGGTLLLFANDQANSEFDHFNTLAQRFGITFNKDLRKHVDGTAYDMGRLTLNATEDPAGLIFTHARSIFVKDICTLTLASPARPVLTDGQDRLMALAHLGRGVVFAFGDPWLYNEYTDGRKLPLTFQNYLAAQDLIHWSVSQSSAKRRTVHR